MQNRLVFGQGLLGLLVRRLGHLCRLGLQVRLLGLPGLQQLRGSLLGLRGLGLERVRSRFLQKLLGVRGRPLDPPCLNLSLGPRDRFRLLLCALSSVSWNARALFHRRLPTRPKKLQYFRDLFVLVLSLEFKNPTGPDAK